MAFQTTSNFFPAPGIPGDLAYLGPEPRVQPRIVFSSGGNNTFGFVFTESTAGDMQTGNTVAVGGSGVFAGVLVQPKAAHTFGTSAGGPLAPTLNLPDYSTGSMLTFGSFFAVMPAATTVGNLVAYNTTTGAIAATFAPAAAFTASQTTTVLTVSAITSGNIGVGSVIVSGGSIIGTVISLGSGTGGTGTYNLNTSATVSSGAMSANSQATAANTKLVPNARVDVYQSNAANIGVITLTN